MEIKLAQIGRQSDPEFLRSVYSSPDAYASARLVTLGDGTERGVRVIEFRTAQGLEAEVTVDRGGDIGRLAINGKTVSWHAPHGMRAPWLLNSENDDGRGFLRGYNGFLNTCGLEHIRQPERDALDDTLNAPSKDAYYPLHGSSTFDPTKLIGYGLNDQVDEPYLWCEVERIESMAMRGALRLRRKFRLPVWGTSISISDQVLNVGHSHISHMMLYHFNIGYPLAAPGTRIAVKNGTEVWNSSSGNPLAEFPSPQDASESEISVFKLSGSSAITQIQSDAFGYGMDVKLDTATLPYVQLLRMTSPGLYGIGIEPCPTKGRSRTAARELDELTILKPNEARDYSIDIQLYDLDNGEG